MLLSVIIPTYNRKQLIGFTLDSLAKKFHPGLDYEVIVVDDHSDDGTLEFVAEKFPEVVLVENPRKGAPAARNTGLAQAKGRYICYLDSDDLIGPGYLNGKVDYLEMHPAIDACYGMYDFFVSDTEFSADKVVFAHKYPLIPTPDRSGDHLIHYLAGNYLPQNAMIWRREFLLKLRGHDERLKINQDVDLMIRAIFNGVQIVGMDDDTFVLVRNHVLDNRVGISGGSREKLENMLSLRKEIYVDLYKYGFDGEKFFKTLSMFLFENWRLIRHFDEKIAKEFLVLAKKIYWPLQLNGTSGLRLLSNLFGPVAAVKIKYFLLKRD